MGRAPRVEASDYDIFEAAVKDFGAKIERSFYHAGVVRLSHHGREVLKVVLPGGVKFGVLDEGGGLQVLTYDCENVLSPFAEVRNDPLLVAAWAEGEASMCVAA